MRKPKKREEPSEDKESSEEYQGGYTFNDILIACIDRGLTLEDARRMELGQIVDFCQTWNELHSADSGSAKSGASSRRASQTDWDKFLG